jgi:hypothetical protein
MSKSLLNSDDSVVKNFASFTTIAVLYLELLAASALIKSGKNTSNESNKITANRRAFLFIFIPPENVFWINPVTIIITYYPIINKFQIKK